MILTDLWRITVRYGKSGQDETYHCACRDIETELGKFKRAISSHLRAEFPDAIEIVRCEKMGSIFVAGGLDAPF